MADIQANHEATATLSQTPSVPHPAEGPTATHARGFADSVGAGPEAGCGAATVDEESGLVDGDGDNSGGNFGGGGGSAGAARAARATERERGGQEASVARGTQVQNPCIGAAEGSVALWSRALTSGPPPDQ
jgi:hypothetical protein